MNALKSGLDAESQFVFGEAPEDFAALQQQYLDEFQPATPQERLYVDTLIRNEWLLRRLFRAESQLWEFHLTPKGIDGGYALGEVLDKASPTFMRLQRRVTLCERSYTEALAELERLQAAREASPQSGESKGETPKSGSFLNSPVSHDPEPPSPGPMPLAPSSAPEPGPQPERPSPPPLGIIKRESTRECPKRPNLN